VTGRISGARPSRLRRDELDHEVGWLTIPEPLPTMPAINSVPATP
jgi:hypothetical protein